MPGTIVITGASSGIGAEAAVALAAKGHTVVPIGRNAQKLDAVVQRIKAAGQKDVTPIQADLQTMQAVRDCTKQVLDLCPRIDVLINNAGVLEPAKAITDDGFERTWAINHLAPFLMTLLLRERLEASHPARVITTSSTASNQGVIDTRDIAGQFTGKGFRGMKTYGSTKLANALFSIELARRWEGTGNTSNHVHPGAVDTSWGRDTWWLKLGKTVAPFVFLTPEKGAHSLIHVASDPEGGTANGKFFSPKAKTFRARPRTRDAEVAAQLWVASEKAVGETWT
jgi:NAD(P)-dependent dehydrogenase (short-subunit alcohol dehydrogenase family)